MFIDKLTIIGVGLIGGSLARALKATSVCGEIVGVGRDPTSLEKAVQLGVIDRYENDPRRAVCGADVVVLAVPVGAMESVLQQIKDYVEPRAIMTDVGSTKRSVIAAAQRVFNVVPANFVPAHPIAGTEKSGVEASFAKLFQERRVVLTPLGDTDPEALDRVRAMWEKTGATVIEMSAARHDEIFAAISHLPHLAAYALVDSLARLNNSTEILAFAAGGFRDFTRIAASDPVMWRDICLANHVAIVPILNHFIDDLSSLVAAIENTDGVALHAIFSRAKALREQLSLPGR